MKTHMKFGIKSKLGLVTAVGSMLMSTSLLAAPTNLTGSVTTSIVNLGGDERRITQTLDVTDPNDPETINDGITFNIRKAGEFFPSSTISGVKVTMRYQVDDIELTLVNTSGGTAGGNPDNLSQTLNAWDTFSIGAITSDGLSQIASGDFAGDLLTLDLSGVVASGDSATAGPSDYTHTESRDVFSSFFGDYSGLGTFANTFDTTIGIFSNVTGSGITNTQSIGAVSFFMEVEYVVIPEVGTLAMMGIAFGSLAGITLYRRRKRV